MKVVVQEFTDKTPLQMIGFEAGVCWNADVSDPVKNKKRAWSCINSGHGRVLEYPNVYMTISGVSARCIREFYTHIGGLPTRLQESTRRVDCTDHTFYCPLSYEEDGEAFYIYTDSMEAIHREYKKMLDAGISVEDAGNALPLGDHTKIVVKMNLRNLIEMFHQRLCTKALKEYRDLMKEIRHALSEYSEEWKEVSKLFVPKCVDLGYCTEAKGCGLCMSKKEAMQILKESKRGE